MEGLRGFVSSEDGYLDTIQVQFRENNETGILCKWLIKPRSLIPKVYGSHLNPIKITALSQAAQELPRIKGSGTEDSVLDEEETDQTCLKSIHMSSDKFPLLQCKAEHLWLPFSISQGS